MSDEPKNRVAPYAPSIPHEFTRKGRAMRGSAFLRNVGLVACAAVLCAVTAMADDPPPPSFDGTKAGQVQDDNGLKMKLVWCPPGEFAMGSPKEEKRHFDDETQVHVTLTQGFWLGQHEVTQSEWRRVMQSAPWTGEDYVKEGDNYPATYVSWADAIGFCRKLSEQEHNAGRLPSGWDYTLPTEAQWEYACRAGTTTRYSFGDAESNLPEYAWFEKNSKDTGEEYAHPVGQKKPNGFGLHDMHGNVMEWCRDWYADKLPGGTDPLVKGGQATDLPASPASKSASPGGAARVFRGGNWFSDAGFCRSAARGKRTPGFRLFNLGFRAALERSVK
jgi:sulfatase modifying factor 1